MLSIISSGLNACMIVTAALQPADDQTFMVVGIITFCFILFANSCIMLLICTALVYLAGSQKAAAASFDELINVNIRKLQEIVTSSPGLAVFANRLTFTNEECSDNDVRWRFVTCTIQLLQLLCEVLSEVSEKSDSSADRTSNCAGSNADTAAPPLCSDAPSLTHRKVVSSALQFVSALGICPLLLPGVGIPLCQRSELACRLLLEDTTSCLSNSDKHYRLTVCVDILLDCLQHQVLASIILSAHVGDLFASLIQVCFSPDWKSYAAEFEKTRVCREDGLEYRHRNYVDELTKLTNRVSSSSLVREVLLLQSGCPPSSNMKVCFFALFNYLFDGINTSYSSNAL